MMIYGLVAACGGGMIGAAIGALPAFILAGLVALAGSIAELAGGNRWVVDYIAFGSYLGPHIAFAGGVAAAAYGASKGELSNGQNIESPLYQISNPMILLVGGFFGMIGFSIHYLLGSVIHLKADVPGCTVVISGIIARLMFDKARLLEGSLQGKKEDSDTKKNRLACELLLGMGVSIAVTGVYQLLIQVETHAVVQSSYPIICFGIAASTLLFSKTGFAVPATHHIALIAALATSALGSLIAGIIFGVGAAVLGGIIERRLNHSDYGSHLDPPACTIFILSFLIMHI